jgi:hypothetical protein
MITNNLDLNNLEVLALGMAKVGDRVIIPHRSTRSFGIGIGKVRKVESITLADTVGTEAPKDPDKLKIYNQFVIQHSETGGDREILYIDEVRSTGPSSSMKFTVGGNNNVEEVPFLLIKPDSSVYATDALINSR